MRIVSLRYQPVEGGALGGHFALHVGIGASNGPGVDMTPTALATKLHDCFEKLGIKHKVKGVLFDCRTSDATNEEMISLLGTLRDWQFFVNLWVNETTRFPWFVDASYITVFVTHPKWPNFRVNEIRYVPYDLPWVEPEVYEVNANAVCYVVAGDFPVSEALTFATSAKRPWGVISPKRKPVLEFKVEE